MGFLKDIFLSIFNMLYPLIHNHFTSYLIFFGIFAFLAWKNWQGIRQGRGKKGGQGFLVTVIRLGLQLFLVLLLAWFLLDHFRTFVYLK